jgi:hypothetical protein
MRCFDLIEPHVAGARGRHDSFLTPSWNRIVPSSDQFLTVHFHCPTCLSTGAPPAASTRNKPPRPKYPIDLLSGDQNGRCTTVAPSILRAIPLKGWTHNEVMSSTVATNVSVSPFGETAMPPSVGSDPTTKRPPGGGAIWNRWSRSLFVGFTRNKRPTTRARDEKRGGGNPPAEPPGGVRCRSPSRRRNFTARVRTPRDAA